MSTVCLGMLFWGCVVALAIKGIDWLFNRPPSTGNWASGQVMRVSNSSQQDWSDYGRGEMDEDPFDRGNCAPTAAPVVDSRTLSMMDVRFRIPDAPMNATEPPVWAVAGKSMMLPEEMQPWDVGITDVFVTNPNDLRSDGRPPLTTDQWGDE